MKLREYAQYDGTELAALVRKGEVTARELALLAIEAVDLLEPELTALIADFRDDVETMSQDNKPEGVFGGVPFIIKDCLLTMEGKPVLNGSRLCQGMTAKYDTELMKRFRASGVTVIGLSKSPEFGYNATTEPTAVGPVHNPWRRNFSPGGSSGGSAAAVAAGYVPIAHGNDGGGSIRIPASACGIVGLKPTRGRNSLAPDFNEAMFGMSCEGVLSRSVRDTAAMLDCTAGSALGDPYVTAVPDGGFLTNLDRPEKGLRIAIAPAPGWAPSPDVEITDLVTQVGQVLTELGHHSEQDEPDFDAPSLNRAISCAWVVGETAWIRALGEMAGRAPGPDTLERTMWNIYQEGIQLSAVDAVSTIAGGFNAASRSVAPFFERYDFLVTPTLAKLPVPHGYLDQEADLSATEWWDRLFTWIPYTPLFNVTGQPAISLPLGVSQDGLPIGIQIAGRFGDEARLLRLARALEMAMPWGNRHPEISVQNKT